MAIDSVIFSSFWLSVQEGKTSSMVHPDLALNGMAVWRRNRAPCLSCEQADVLPPVCSFFTHYI